MDANTGLFKMKKFVSDASTVFNRAVQFTEEKLGSAEKTELDAHFENLLQRADKTKAWTEKILKQTESVLQPNPNIRMEDFVYEKLDKKKRDRVNHHEVLGHVLVDGGNDFGPGTTYGNALVKCGQAQLRIGNAEREFIQTTSNNFLQPLHNFLEGDMKTIQKEKKILETKRLDLDASKNRLRKAKSTSQPQSSQNSPQNVLMMVEEENPVRFHLAEADLRVAQAEFDRQAEITKLLLEGVSSAHAHHLRCLNDFIEAQLTYYAQCQNYISELQQQLGSYSHTSGVGNNSSNSLGAGISSGIPSSVPLQPSAPPQINVIAATPNIEKKQARVLYDYDAADSSELTLLADELITVYKTPGLDPDWLMAERGPQKGKVPTTYLEVLE
ncbi:endophilin-B1-like isoform X2 [Crassostrea angulata]|uniref:endophilin-B1-like isoform X2 n=1 Tax=Magallana angulata TaxID=2784310 RepID=UPI0022B1D6BD|nr:endophilin-B1-like isoform X2 [Crassostrea angulata]